MIMRMLNKVSVFFMKNISRFIIFSLSFLIFFSSIFSNNFICHAKGNLSSYYDNNYDSLLNEIKNKDNLSDSEKSELINQAESIFQNDNSLLNSFSYLLAMMGFSISGAGMKEIVVPALAGYMVDTEEMPIDDNGNVSESTINFVYNAVNNYYEDNAPKYKIVDTIDFRTFYKASNFVSKNQYDQALELLKNENQIISSFSPTYNCVGSITSYLLEEEVYFCCASSYTHSTSYWIDFYNKDWQIIRSNVMYYSYSTATAEYELSKKDSKQANFGFSFGDTGYGAFEYIPTTLPISYKNGKPLMVFDSREHAIDYLTGTSSIYKGTSSYTGGAITLPENCSVINYGEMYTNINSGIQNGMTADEIQKLIDSTIASYLGNSNNNSGNSGNSGNVSGNDSGSSGGGLTGFLSGLGSIGDAILSILGKLLEYLGKAVQLLVDVIANIIDIIPTNFTNLLTALFPFFPHEWVTAVELFLVLGIILVIIKSFK